MMGFYPLSTGVLNLELSVILGRRRDCRPSADVVELRTSHQNRIRLERNVTLTYGLKQLLLLLSVLSGFLVAQEVPRIAKKDGRFTLLVESKPFLMLGAQINNSSSWASSLPHVWPALEAMHANTVEAPVYWEQMEPEQGKFDFSSVDQLVTGAREHK